MSYVEKSEPGFEAINVGTGVAHSVTEVIEAIDTIIANLKVSERYSDNVLGKTIMSEYMAYIEANPARKSADRLTFTRLNKDYMAGRLKLEDVVWGGTLSDDVRLFLNHYLFINNDLEQR